MKMKVSEIEVVFPDVIVEIDGKKHLDLEALKVKLEALRVRGFELAILPDGPPPTGR